MYYFRIQSDKLRDKLHDNWEDDVIDFTKRFLTAFAKKHGYTLPKNLKILPSYEMVRQPGDITATVHREDSTGEKRDYILSSAVPTTSKRGYVFSAVIQGDGIDDLMKHASRWLSKHNEFSKKYSVEHLHDVIGRFGGYASQVDGTIGSSAHDYLDTLMGIHGAKGVGVVKGGGRHWLFPIAHDDKPSQKRDDAMHDFVGDIASAFGGRIQMVPAKAGAMKRVAKLPTHDEQYLEGLKHTLKGYRSQLAKLENAADEPAKQVLNKHYQDLAGEWMTKLRDNLVARHGSDWVKHFHEAVSDVLGHHPDNKPGNAVSKPSAAVGGVGEPVKSSEAGQSVTGQLSSKVKVK